MFCCLLANEAAQSLVIGYRLPLTMIGVEVEASSSCSMVIAEDLVLGGHNQYGQSTSFHSVKIADASRGITELSLSLPAKDLTEERKGKVGRGIEEKAPYQLRAKLWLSEFLLLV